MTPILNTLSDSRLITLLQDGAVGVLPTDTVYGLVCRAANPQAVAKLYQLKSRQKKPGTVIAASSEQLIQIGLKSRYIKAVEQFWPNAISVIIPADANTQYLHLGTSGIACRVVDSPKELQLLLSSSGALLTTSANLPGQPIAESLSAAQKYFGDAVDFYVDGGELSNHAPSTVIRIVDDEIQVLREGAVKLDENGMIVS